MIFPVLHGKFGEDGTIQGVFEMSGIPYVGCGVLSSSVSMDKISTKIFVEKLGIRQAKFVADIAPDLSELDHTVAEVEEKLGSGFCKTFECRFFLWCQQSGKP